jgi:hypothetical protein
MTEHDSELKTEIAKAVAVDAFLEAVGAGDEIGAATALRQIASLTDALQSMALEVLIGLKVFRTLITRGH